MHVQITSTDQSEQLMAIYWNGFNVNLSLIEVFNGMYDIDSDIVVVAVSCKIK